MAQKIFNKKTKTDLDLEKYFNQRGIKFQFESHYDRGKVPDYFISKNDKDLLIECEEIEKLPSDTLTEGTGTIDLASTLEVLRKKIKVASKQLKPYVNDVDHLIIMIGKKEGYYPTSLDLYWAMFGDPIMRVPLIKNSIKRKKAYADLQVKGAMRKNDPITKEMCFPYDYIGGVGLIKSFNGLGLYKNLLFDKYNSKNEKKDLEILLSEVFDFMDLGWSKYKDEIPYHILENPEKLIFQIEMVINPLSKRQLPKNIFNGRWDKNISPTLLETIGLS